MPKARLWDHHEWAQVWLLQDSSRNLSDGFRNSYSCLISVDLSEIILEWLWINLHLIHQENGQLSRTDELFPSNMVVRIACTGVSVKARSGLQVSKQWLHQPLTLMQFLGHGSKFLLEFVVLVTVWIPIRRGVLCIVTLTALLIAIRILLRHANRTTICLPFLHLSLRQTVLLISTFVQNDLGLCSLLWSQRLRIVPLFGLPRSITVEAWTEMCTNRASTAVRYFCRRSGLQAGKTAGESLVDWPINKKNDTDLQLWPSRKDGRFWYTIFQNVVFPLFALVYLIV